MYQQLLGAQQSIFWEIYIFVDDHAGRRFVDLLCSKAIAGVEVKLVIDSVGSRFLTKKTVEQLRAAGVKVLYYNEFQFEIRFRHWFMRLWHRNHRKVLIIDEKTVFVGGVNITFIATEWDDLFLKLEGADVAMAPLRAFAKTYVISGGDRKDVQKFLMGPSHNKSVAWDGQLVFVALAPHRGSDRKFLRNFYLQAVAQAEKRFTLITPYYIPYKKFLSAIVAARRRGVEVEIIMPVRSDHKLLDYMSYYFLEFSERLGATIYLLPKMNHGKGFLVDDTAGLVGSSNFTRRSFFANAESDIFFTQADLVARLRATAEAWKKTAASQLSESGRKKELRIRSGLVNWIAKHFSDYV